MSGIYPAVYVERRVVHLDGLAKSELIAALATANISINPLAEQLLTSECFTTSNSRSRETTVELTVHHLGFPSGATISEIYERAEALGLDLCRLEVATYMRLQYTDQPEGHLGKPVREHQAPYGSITIASPIPDKGEDFPQGFYLRRIDDVLWLRGYRSGPDHVWKPDDHFTFLCTG